MKISVSKRDREFAQLIKERDDFVCRKCYHGYSPGDRGIQAAHLFSRRYRATRWDPQNAFTLCTHCHLAWAHTRSLEFHVWARKELGDAVYEALAERAGALHFKMA